MRQPILTRDLALRVGRSESDHMASWLTAIADMAGNPFDAKVSRLCGATALLGERLGPLFNRLLDFSDDDLPILNEAVRMYADRGLPCRIDVNPHAVSGTTMSKLVEAGFHPFRHHDHLYGLPQVLESEGNSTGTGIEVYEVGEPDCGSWAHVWRRGFLEVTGILEADRELVGEATSRLAFDPRWTLFLAVCDGKPAAGAGLYVHDGVASLAFAGTDPDFRGRGCQTALLQARLQKAAILGCDLIAAQAALDAQSHRNMQRARLRIAYTRAFWLRCLP